MSTYTVFHKMRRLAQGSRGEIVQVLRNLPAPEAASDLLVFEDETGKQIDLDLSDMPAPVRGRPALGVTAREVTLLPRHWDWLTAQPGGASPALRRLVETAIRADGGRRQAIDAAYRFLTAMAGDRPHYEAAIRALYADDRAALETHMAGWPEDIRAHAVRLAYP
ncbi:MAG TPA: DUF2239 family protein [Stellaceae bacterium]|nr:DUF2239 family protein [Stellaceae bacterium]